MNRQSFGAARAEAETALGRHERECRERTERQHREMLAFQQEMRTANAQLRLALDLVNQRVTEIYRCIVATLAGLVGTLCGLAGWLFIRVLG